MEDLTTRPTIEYIPPLPPKQRGSTTYTQITTDQPNSGFNDIRMDLSSMHSHVLNTKSSTVFIAASPTERPAITPSTDALDGQHVVTIRINTDTDKPKPKISSVHLKSDVDFNKINDLYKKNSLVRLNGDDRPKIIETEDLMKNDKAPYIYCNSYMNSMTNMVMSSGQCSPSDTLDSGTCSDLDGTPPPLPKKKTTKSSAKKAISVTMISPRNGSQSEVDFEDNDSNISYDSLNSSEFNGSLHADESHAEYRKREKSQTDVSVASETSFEKTTNKDSFLPQGLLQDIRDRTAKLSTVETESESSEQNEELSQNINEDTSESKESVLTSFRLVSQVDSEHRNSDEEISTQTSLTKPPLITETTYEERKQDKVKQEQDLCYSSHYFDTDKFYDFHLNETQFDEPVKSVSVAKSESEAAEAEYFAGIKDYKAEEAPSTIRSSKGTIRGVKNRVRAGIATFLQIQSTTKSYREKDAGKVVLYTTTMGIVRSTYQRCVLVKKILRNLLIKYDERDVFMSTEYQDEIRDRMKSDEIMVPQLFVDGQHIGDADTVEKLNESGELRKMLKPYKSPDACTTCQVCGGFRLLPCRICNGSKKSLHRNHFTAEFVALKCMNCDEVGLVRCDACS